MIKDLMHSCYCQRYYLKPIIALVCQVLKISEAGITQKSFRLNTLGNYAEKFSYLIPRGIMKKILC